MPYPLLGMAFFYGKPISKDMINFLDIPSTVLGLVGIVSLIITGGFVIVSIFDKVRKQRVKEANEEDDRLIALLKDELDALKRKVDDLEIQGEERTERLEKLEARNELLEEIFQGRDEQTKEFMKKGFVAMQLGAETHQLALETKKEVTRNSQSIEKLYKAIESHLNVMAQDHTRKEELQVKVEKLKEII